MFISRLGTALLWGFLVPLSPAAIMADSPNLGIAITSEEASAWDISIGPDGRGLPPGRGSATEGAKIFTQKCQACHGEGGGGQPLDRLVGGRGSLVSTKPIKTVGSYWPYATTLFDYVRRAMPWNAPKSLTNDEVYALSAYILFRNDIIPEKAIMDARTLPRVRMPNRGNFEAYPPGGDIAHAGAAN